MEMQAVKSSAVTHVGHDGKDLHVVYKGGKTYIHANVPAAKFEALMAAPSKGTYLSQHISKQHAGKLKKV